MLPRYVHRFSPKKFTQHQLFACLVLKSILDLDYRGIVALLQDCPNLCAAINLTNVPHFTTLQKAATRLLCQRHEKRFHDQTVRAAEECQILKPTTALAAVDANSFETHHCSRYFIRRCERGQKGLKKPLYQKTAYRRFPKARIVVDHRSRIILSSTATRGPSPDITQLARLMVDVLVRRRIRTVALDTGHDAEWAQELLRHDMGIRSIIPRRIGRRTKKLPTGYYRAMMRRRVPKKQCAQCWHAETVFSTIERRQGESVCAVRYWAKCRPIMLKVLTHNIMIIRCHRRDFLRSRTVPIFCGCVSRSRTQEKASWTNRGKRRSHGRPFLRGSVMKFSNNTFIGRKGPLFIKSTALPEHDRSV